MSKFETKNINYKYFLHYIKQIPEWESLRVLDFGCGNGDIVKLLKQNDIDCYGVDVFYDGASYEILYEDALFKSGTIRVIYEDGDLPFEDRYFDVIISNVVLEHIKDKDCALKKLRRVLKDDGLMYHHFPSRDVIRERHIGLPFVHWLPKGKFRYHYAVLMRRLGFGYFSNGISVSDWAKEKLNWIDKYCFYESHKSLYDLFSKEFIVSYHEIDYCRFRAQDNQLLQFLLKIDFMRELYQKLFRRLAFMAIELRKIKTRENQA